MALQEKRKWVFWGCAQDQSILRLERHHAAFPACTVTDEKDGICIGI